MLNESNWLIQDLVVSMSLVASFVHILFFLIIIVYQCTYSRWFYEAVIKFSNSLFIENLQLLCHKLLFLNKNTTTGRWCVWEASSPKALKALCGHVPCGYCALINLYLQRHGRSLEKTSGEKNGELEPTESSSPPLTHTRSRIHISFLSHLSSSQLCTCDFLCCSLGVWLGASCPLSSSYLLCLSLCSSCLPLLSLALLSLLLTLFLRWLPTHSFLYACLLTKGRGRCSPRCSERTAGAEPLKALESAPRWPSPLLHDLPSKRSCRGKTAKLASTSTHT